MLRFLIQLTHKSDRQLITIPKIISITNNLLANGSVQDVALLALKTLSYELFFMHSQIEEALDTDSDRSRAACQSPLSATPTPETREALMAQRRELDTQREVVLGMLEKFIEARPSQQVLALLLLFERSGQLTESPPPYHGSQDADAVYGALCRGLCTQQWRLHSARDLRLVESCFRNNENYVLADSKGFLQLLQLFIEQVSDKICSSLKLDKALRPFTDGLPVNASITACIKTLPLGTFRSLSECLSACLRYPPRLKS